MNDNEWGILYLVPTPIGNLEDMTYRAVRILGEVDAIAAEDTRHTGILLKHFDIKKPLISYHEHNKEEKGTYIIELLLEGQSIACVSDAGMPAISDPGADLVTKAIEEGITVVPLPGANAAYEAFGNRSITVARELTKKFETFVRTDLESLVNDLEQLTYKGEFVLIVGGADTVESDTSEVSDEPVSYVNAVQALVETGVPKKEAIRQVAKRFNVSRRDVYNIVER